MFEDLARQALVEQNRRTAEHLQATWKRQILEASEFKERYGWGGGPDAKEVLHEAFQWTFRFQREVLAWRGVYEFLMDMAPKSKRRKKNEPYVKRFTDYWDGDRTFGFYFQTLEQWDYELDMLMKGGSLDQPQVLRFLSYGIECLEIKSDPLPFPKLVHPTRHARVVEGRLAHIVGEDVRDQLREGEDLQRALTASPLKPKVVYQWRNQTAEVLRQFGDPVADGFMDTMKWVTVCELPMPDPARLSQGYVMLGLQYLVEVLERVPGYIEASQQAVSPPSVTINGSTIYNAQIAATITNLDSTIAGILQSGQSETATALQALENAVISQQGLTDGARQDLLDNVADLAEAAQVPPAERRGGRVKSALTFLRNAAATGSELARAVQATESAFRQITG